MSKTLSTGTLSLKFMQNAHRAKQQAQVELEQAKIKDDAEWEVPQEIKDAWGLGSSPSESRSSQSASYESSYIPFLFSGSSDDNAPKAKGRRTFNGQGQEVKTEAPEKDVPEDNDQEAAEPPVSAKRLTSISGFKVPLPTKEATQKRVKHKTAQELIREDVRQRPSELEGHSASSSRTGFIKPAGVDGPSVDRQTADTASALSSLKRNRDGESGPASNAEAKKRRKKKEVPLVD